MTIDKVMVRVFSYTHGIDVRIAGGLAEAKSKNKLLRMEVIHPATITVANTLQNIKSGDFIYVIDEHFRINKTMNSPYIVEGKKESFYLIDSSIIVGINILDGDSK